MFMGFLFGSKPKSVEPPPIEPPPATPGVGEEVGDIARRKRKRDRRELFLTGDLIPAQDTKKSTLG